MRRQQLVLKIGACIALALLPLSALAADITVDSTADNLTGDDGNCTLREAIANANSDTDTTSGDCVAGSGADTILFDSSIPDGSTITLGGTHLAITSDISIRPFPPVDGLTISGNAVSRVFLIDASTADIEIDHVTIYRGRISTGTSPDSEGAGMLVASANSVTITNSMFYQNGTNFLTSQNTGDGGALKIVTGTVTLRGVTFSGNRSADDGGAINVGAPGFSPTLILENVTMCNNLAKDDGGAIEAQATATVSMNWVTLVENDCGTEDTGSAGGGVYSNGAGTAVTMQNSIVAGNRNLHGSNPDVDEDCDVSVGSITSSGYNLLDSGGNCPSVATDVVCPGECGGSDATPAGCTLADNGGPVQTHALATTDPGVDAIPGRQSGCPDAADARGVDRPVNAGTCMCCDIGAFEYTTAPVPVTLAYFSSHEAAGTVFFEWSTATEVGNVGFRILGGDCGRRSLHDDLVESKVFAGTTRHDYSLSLPVYDTEFFYLEDIDFRNQRRLHGPFRLGQSYGTRTVPRSINWRSPERRPTPSTKAATETIGADLLVDEDGLYRVSRADLLPFGIDLAATPQAPIELTSGGEEVAFYLGETTGFDRKPFLEFLGRGMDTLYTDTNVYRLRPATISFEAGAGVPVRTVGATEKQLLSQGSDRRPPVIPRWYPETLVFERNRAYSFLSPSDDPWYDTRLLARTGPASESFSFEIDDMVPGTAPATLTLELWGQTDWEEDPEHHVVVEINGIVVAERFFDGLEQEIITVELAEDIVADGTNSLTVTLPHDLGVMWDIVMVERFELSYPRCFRARDGVLEFEAAGDLYEVGDLPGPEVIVYRLDVDPPLRHELLGVADENGGYRIRFGGSPEGGRYLVVDADRTSTPVMRAVPAEHDIISGKVDYLMISHPAFIEHLSPLIDHHRGLGRQVRVVDVTAIYEQFNHGIFDAVAIDRYLAQVAESLGVRWVLLVGGDSYDYRDYLGLGSMSFIPSLYAQTDAYVRYAPVDPAYVDLDSDDVPDIAIGRLPVRTVEELEAVINKTLLYAVKDWGESMVVAADRAAEMSFSAAGDELLGTLPPYWSAQRAYIDLLGVEDARALLIESIDLGVAVTGFVGHSGPDSWTFEGLLTGDDVVALANHHRPTVVLQWGCWNTYYVDPAYDTMAHAFMLHPTGGAAAVLGATAITEASAELELGRRLMPRLVEAETVGEAMTGAKQELAAAGLATADVVLGWTLLGDPALVVPD